MKTKFYLLPFLLLIFSADVFAQLDTKHWIPPFFAKVEDNTGTQNIRDHFVSLSTPAEDTIPVVIRDGFGALIDTVFISKASPQEYTFGPQGNATGNPATSVYPLNVIPRDSLNMPIRSQGLYFESFQPFFVNMRHKSGSQGFSLTSKGQVGLGTKFFSGHIHTLKSTANDADSWNNERRSHFISVMATEDNTQVTFDLVKDPIVFIDQDVPQGEPITVTLNAFESYVVGVDHNDLTDENVNNLNGTRITSDKPIVCNSGSWLSGPTDGQCIGADQLVTAEVTGQEYILVRGLGDEETERPMVVAIEDGTEVFVNDETDPIAVLDEGEFYFIETEKFTDEENLYILATEKIYCFQTVSGSSSSPGPTVGLSFIPPLNCVGAKEVNLPFVNSLAGGNGQGRINIITKAGTSIFVNDNPTPISGAQVVTGNSEWVTYAFDPPSNNVNIVSDSVMNVALLTRDGVVGSSGYFSGFTLEPVVGISSEIQGAIPCIPGNAVLQVFGFDAYQWYYEGEEIEGATGNTLVPSFAGQYSVEGIDIACGFRFPSNPFNIPFCPSTLGAAKQVQSVQETAPGSRIFDVTYRIFVENLAESISQNIQIIEDITTGLPPGATAEVVDGPTQLFNFLVGGLNPNFDGINDTRLLPGTGFLNGFEEGSPQNQDAIDLTIRVDMNNATADGYRNQAIISSINQGTNDGVTGPFNGQDFSDDGNNVDANGNGEPNEEGENDVNLTCFFPNTFEYAAESFCVTDEDQEITLDGVSSGIFSIDLDGLFIVDTTGVISPQQSIPGTYTVTFTVGGSCPTVTTTEVTIIDTPNPGTGSSIEVCEQSEVVDLNALLEDADEGGVWTNINGNPVSDVFDPLEPGNNTFTYSVVNEPCAALSSEVSVNVIAEPATGSLSGNDSFCFDEVEVTLGDLLVDQQVDGVWTDADGNVLTDAFVFPSDGEFTLTYTVENEVCGERSIEAPISVTAVPNVGTPIAGDTTFCVGQEVDLAGLLEGQDEDGEWFDSDGNQTDQFVITDEVGTEIYDYQIERAPCATAAQIVSFEVVEPNVSPGVPNTDQAELCNEDALINLFDYLDDEDTGGQWTDQDGFDVSSTFAVTEDTEGLFEFTYTVDAGICGELSSTVSINVDQENCSVIPPPVEFVIPEAFSPNGDGINDQFIIRGLTELYPNNSLQIFNRWGAEILNMAPYNNDWDGKAETGLNAGEVLPVGTYWFILDLGDGSEPIMDFIYLNR
jgi:gliding motility-associated-like protein